jgi:hypothetical protein
MIVATDWPDVVVAYAPVFQTVGGTVVGAAATYFGSRSLWSRERQEREQQAMREQEERASAQRAKRTEEATARLVRAFEEMRVSVLNSVAKGDIASHYGGATSAAKDWNDARADASDKALALHFTSRSATVRQALDVVMANLDVNRSMDDARLDLEEVGKAIELELDDLASSPSPS